MILAAITFTLLLVTAVFGISAYVGWNLTHPEREGIDTNPGAVGLPYEEISFKSRFDGLTLKGWLIRAPGNSKTVILAHGYGKNRLQNDLPGLSLANGLFKDGCNILMFDFRSCGESEGSIISLGQYEVHDLLGAVDFIKSKPELNQEIVLFGFSAGAVTSLLAGAREPAVAAVIADAPFADLKSYLMKNLSIWTNLPSFPFNQAFLTVVPPLTSLHTGTVSPVREIKNFNGRPVLLIHGDADNDIPIENSELLQQEYPTARLLKVPGAAHVKSYSVDEDKYLREVSLFLKSLQ